MTQGERNETISWEILKAKKNLTLNPSIIGFGIVSDIFQLSDGRDAQIHITVTVDEEEFEKPTESFIEY